MNTNRTTRAHGQDSRMRAAVYRRFGNPEVVHIERVPKPSPRRNEVLVRVCASTVSAADHRVRSRTVPRGLGPMVAIALGVFRPRKSILGVDVSGVIEAVGTNVTAFRPGDEVIAMLGVSFGGHAEYVCVSQTGAITEKPHNMTFDEAVTLVFGGMTAQTFLSRCGNAQGHRVLVNGASGAVGTAAVQLAAAMGARVTGVCSGANRQLVTSLGAERVIDYAAEDFLTEGQPYDVIMDCVGNAPFERAGTRVKHGGALLLVVCDLKGLLLASWHSKTSGKMVTAGSAPDTALALAVLVDLAEAGRFQAVIDRTYALDEIVEAHRYVDTGRKRGNVVVHIATG